MSKANKVGQSVIRHSSFSFLDGKYVFKIFDNHKDSDDDADDNDNFVLHYKFCVCLCVWVVFLKQFVSNK